MHETWVREKQIPMLLIVIRLKDVVSELAETNGLQRRRSYWISRVHRLEERLAVCKAARQLIESTARGQTGRTA